MVSAKNPKDFSQKKKKKKKKKPNLGGFPKNPIRILSKYVLPNFKPYTAVTLCKKLEKLRALTFENK